MLHMYNSFYNVFTSATIRHIIVMPIANESILRIVSISEVVLFIIQGSPVLPIPFLIYLINFLNLTTDNYRSVIVPSANSSRCSVIWSKLKCWIVKCWHLSIFSCQNWKAFGPIAKLHYHFAAVFTAVLATVYTFRKCII